MYIFNLSNLISNQVIMYFILFLYEASRAYSASYYTYPPDAKFSSNTMPNFVGVR